MWLSTWLPAMSITVGGCNLLLGIDEFTDAPPTSSSGGTTGTAASGGQAVSTTASGGGTGGAGGVAVGGAAGGGAGGGPSAKRVFVTSSSVSSVSVGSPSVASSLCDSVAWSVPGLTGTSWRAWISTSTFNATATFGAGPWYLIHPTTKGPDGSALVATGIVQLTSGNIAAPIDRNEYGTTVSSQQVWTGTSGVGTFSQVNCSDWNSTAMPDQGTVGNSGLSSVTWTDQTGAGCDGAHPIYCFEL